MKNNYKWIARKKDYPRVCPKCKSPCVTNTLIESKFLYLPTPVVSRSASI